MRSRPFSRRAFTLVEVLIAVAMVAVLLAILVPALQAGRAASRRAACAGNLHRLGEAVDHMVASEDGFPGLYSGAGWQWGGMRFSRALGGQAHVDFDRPLNGHLPLYLPPAALEEMFRCPADAGIRGDIPGTGTGTRTTYESFGTSYRANERLFDARLAGVSDTPRPLALAEIVVAPSKLVVLGDPVWYEVYAATGRYADWHGEAGVGNLLLLDGSVRFQPVRRQGKRGPAVIEPVWPVPDRWAADGREAGGSAPAVDAPGASESASTFDHQDD